MSEDNQAQLVAMAATGCPECALLGPAIDAQVLAANHNHQHTRIGRLPEEMNHLHDDVPALLCLTRVSKLLRRLLSGPVAAFPELAEGMDPPRAPRTYWHAQYMQLRREDPLAHQQLLTRLWRDTLCLGCQQHGLRGGSPARALERPQCKFSSLGRSYLCLACYCYHPSNTFSAAPRPDGKQSACIGRDGVVRVCEHRSISWDDIQDSYLNRGLGGLGIDANGSVDVQDTMVRCDNPSHTTCAGSTPPRAWLQNTPRDVGTGNRILLHLLLEVHSTLDVDSQGRLHAPDLRSMFQRHAGTSKVRPSQPGSEWHMGMGCFSHQECTCVHIETGGVVEELEAGDTSVKGYKGCLDTHPERHFAEGTGFALERLSVRVCSEKPSAPGKQCIVTQYKRQIEFRDEGFNLLKPSHQWLHALDPNSYMLGDGSRFPTCREPTCRN